MTDERPWNQTRIAELRRLAGAVDTTTKWGPRWLDATAAYEEATSTAVVLSLLDELERVRRERDEAREGLTTAYMVGYEKARGQLLDALHRLAMMGMQSDRYVRDADYRDAVDDALALVKP